MADPVHDAAEPGATPGRGLRQQVVKTADIAADHEVAAGAPQHHDPHGRVHGHGIEGRPQCRRHFQVEGVVAGRPIEGEGGHRPFAGHQDMGFRHGPAFPWGNCLGPPTLRRETARRHSGAMPLPWQMAPNNGRLAPGPLAHWMNPSSLRPPPSVSGPGPRGLKSGDTMTFRPTGTLVSGAPAAPSKRRLAGTSPSVTWYFFDLSCNALYESEPACACRSRRKTCIIGQIFGD